MKNLLFVLAVIAAGCGDNRLARVTGTVRYADGKPVDRAIIEFELQAEKYQDRISSLGQVRPDGTFELSTYREGDGAFIGEHRILVSPPEILPPDPGEPPAPPFRAFPKKYRSFETSGLIATVVPGDNTFTIVLE